MVPSRQFAVSILATALWACSAGGDANSASVPPGTEAIDRNAPESFSYVPAQNRQIKVVVGPVLMRTDKGYLPKDSNWLQAPITVTNLGQRTVSLEGVRAKLADGLVLAAAGSSDELTSPPSLTGMSAKGLGIGAAGMAAGWLIFPPLAIVAGVVGQFTNLGGIDGWSKRKKRIDSSLLRGQLISPGTSVSGTVFLPAVKGQTGLIALYTIDGRAESLSIARVGR